MFFLYEWYIRIIIRNYAIKGGNVKSSSLQMRGWLGYKYCCSSPSIRNLGDRTREDYFTWGAFFRLYFLLVTKTSKRYSSYLRILPTPAMGTSRQVFYTSAISRTDRMFVLMFGTFSYAQIVEETTLHWNGALLAYISFAFMNKRSKLISAPRHLQLLIVPLALIGGYVGYIITKLSFF